MLMCSVFALFSVATWGEPIGVRSLQPVYVQEKAAVQETVRAKEFVLVNEQGAPVGTFGTFGGRPGLMLRDQTNKVRLVLGVDEGGQPGFALIDENGKIRAQFDIEGNASRLVLLDKNGKTTFQAPQ